MYIPSSFSNNKYGNWAFFKNKPEFERFKFERMSFLYQFARRAPSLLTVCKGNDNGNGSSGGGGGVVIVDGDGNGNGDGGDSGGRSGGIRVVRPTCYIL